MRQRLNTIVFFGNEQLATGVSTDAPVLQSLISAGYQVAAVVASYKGKSSTILDELAVARVAKQHNIPLLFPGKLSEISGQLKSFDAQAGVLIAYGRIIPQAIIDVFPKGIINLHPSLLPRHRGPTPLESAILNGDQLSGVTIMSLASTMDAGPIYAQSEVSLDSDVTKQQLADTMLEVGGAMLIETLPGILGGSIVAMPQDDSAATYDKLIAKSDGKIDWNKSATQLEREIRAYSGWPSSRTTFGGLEVTINKAHIISTTSGQVGALDISSNQLTVTCGKDSLVIDELKPSGKKLMAGTDFIRGYGYKIRA